VRSMSPWLNEIPICAQEWLDMLRWACRWLESRHLDEVDHRDTAGFVPLADHNRYGGQVLLPSKDISELNGY